MGDRDRASGLGPRASDGTDAGEDRDRASGSGPRASDGPDAGEDRDRASGSGPRASDGTDAGEDRDRASGSGPRASDGTDAGEDRDRASGSGPRASDGTDAGEDRDRASGLGPRASHGTDADEARGPNPAAEGPEADAPDREHGDRLASGRTAGDAPPGRWTRAVSIEHAESELSDLWREVSRSGGPTSRSLMSNLIVYAEGDTEQASPDELAEASRLHPSRVIIVHYAPGANEQAEIAIHTHGQGVAQFGVELVTMNVGDREAVPSLLRRLTIGALPTSICWAVETLPAAKTVHYLAPLGRQFVYDSSVWANPVEALRTMAPLGSQGGAEIDVADLTWRRLKPLRHAIVQAVDPSVLQRPLGHLRALTIQTGHTQEASAWLLAAWIASRLGWQPVRREARESTTSVTFNARGGDSIVVIQLSNDETLRATFETRSLPDTATLDATHAGEEIVIRYGWDVPPLTMMAPRRSRAEMLAAELRNLYVDSFLRDALKLVARVETL